MRHGKKLNHLSRKSAHRKAMLANMACSLIERKRINTTLAKAKALRQYVEPLITKSKDDTTHSRRVVFSYLKNKEAVSELFRDVAPKVAERNGGYTRILKTGNRLGDNAEMCFIELVDFNETYAPDKKDKKTTRRSRRGGGKPASAETQATTAKTEEVKAEAPVEEKAEEAPATKEEPKAETPKAEAKEVEVKAEETEAKADEAPAAETVEEVKEEKKEEVEAKAEEAADDSKEENKEEEKKEEDGEEEKKD